MTDRWWEHLDPAPITDEWMARQVISFHRNPGTGCAGCKPGQPCTRLAEAHTFLGDGSTTDASVVPSTGSTVRP